MGLGKLLNFGASRTNVVPSIQHFPAIDTQGMIKRMRLAARAGEQAGRELPSSDSRGFDTVEQDIVNEINNEAKSQFDTYLEDQKTYVDRARSLAIHSLLSRIGAAADDAVATFAARTRNGANVLYLLRKDVIETEQELERFRKRQHLTRPARHTGSRTLKFGVLAIILLVESIANGLFLQRGSTLGLIGGVGQAMVIAFINVAIGVLTGWKILPWLTHKNWLAKLFAFSGFLVYVAAAVGFNIVVAHYRTAMSGDPFEAARVTLQTLQAHPFQVDDVQSWLLFAVGVIFSAIATIDAWMMDDPYPGYGRVTRDHQEAAEIYTEQKEELLGELEDIYEGAQAAINTCVRDIDVRQGEYDSILARSQTLQAAMIQHLDHLESAGNTLLRFYRNENRKHRKTAPPPRFDEPWKLSRPVIEERTVPGRVRDQIDAALKEAMTEGPAQRKKLQDAYLEAMAEYKKIDDLTAKDIGT